MTPLSNHALIEIVHPLLVHRSVVQSHATQRESTLLGVGVSQRGRRNFPIKRSVSLSDPSAFAVTTIVTLSVNYLATYAR